MTHWFTAVTLFDRLSCSPSTQICIYQLICNMTETYVHLLLNCKIRCVLIDRTTVPSRMQKVF